MSRVILSNLSICYIQAYRMSKNDINDREFEYYDLSRDNTISSPAGGTFSKTQTGLRFIPDSDFIGEVFTIFEINENSQNIDTMFSKLKVGPQKFSIEVKQGWNLVSLPLESLMSFDQLLEQIPNGQAWVWRNNQYQEPDNLRVGEGIWLYSGVDRNIDFVGEPVSDVVVDLEAGWNLVGTINNDRTIFRENDRISSILTWRRGQYNQSQSIESGNAYWVHVDESHVLELR